MQKPTVTMFREAQPLKCQTHLYSCDFFTTKGQLGLLEICQTWHSTVTDWQICKRGIEVL